MHNKTNQIVVEYTGEINNENIKSLEKKVLSKKTILKEQHKKDILISLKGIVYKNNQKDLILMINAIGKDALNNGINICFIDYGSELFTLLARITKKTKIKLFKNIEIANIFLDPHGSKKEMSILVFDEDDQTSKSLASTLTNFGHTVLRPTEMQNFLNRMNSDEYDIVVTRSALNHSHLSLNSLSLAKKVIIHLPIFMNKAVETLESFTSLQAKKLHHKIKGFDTSIGDEHICAVMHFRGDLEGIFTLIFPKDIAAKALESLLGEKIALEDIETLKDGIGEFCNIITGATKTAFDEQNIKLTYDLPKTFISLEETQEFIGDNNGVWMDMELSQEPFYIFITK